MKRHRIVVRLGAADNVPIPLGDPGLHVTILQFIQANRRLDHGIGQMLDELSRRGLSTSEVAVDLAILAAAVTAADTSISRFQHGQDSWTREIDLDVPVEEPDLWNANSILVKCILDYLTGDLWRVVFRPRSQSLRLSPRSHQQPSAIYDSVALFSGGLDSFVGAIDLLEDQRKPLFVSHYHDASTSRQPVCAAKLGRRYGDLGQRHVRANVGFNKKSFVGRERENTTRGRSFLFFALAAMAASAMSGRTTVIVPENGLISLNVPLDSLRVSSRSTRTTHPFYMARWQNLLNCLGIDAVLRNPYRFKTKGEMLSECKNRRFLEDNLDKTISCSSMTKGRWKGHGPIHCGYCTPCLIRRASIDRTFDDDPTKYSIEDLRARPLNARMAESEDVRAFQLMVKKLQRRPELADLLVYAPGPLRDYSSSEVADYADVFRRGLAEVGAIVSGLVVRPS